MSKIVIIDYQLGNLFSVRQALHNIGLEVVVSKDPEELKTADAAVLPGVGAFGDAMNNLRSQGLDEGIHEHIATGKPFMGVCLGLQLLFTESEEFGSSKGLDLLPGTVKKFKKEDGEHHKIRVPQIAWNEIYKGSKGWEGTPLQSLDQNEHMYFVHSYYVESTDKECILSLTQYHDKVYTSSVLKDNIFACQFHPEKSAEKGLGIYRDWANLNKLI
jgi:imidazole glycerol-phosphate synthase subunit HisH